MKLTDYWLIWIFYHNSMRLRIISIITLTIIKISISQAQGTYVGLKGGYHLSTLNSDNASRIELETLKGFSMSLVFGYVPGYNSVLGFSVEPGYTLKGTKTNVDTLSYRFKYLTLPLLVDYYPFKNLKISAGPEISFLARAQNKAREMPTDSTEADTDISNIYNKRFELSGSIGVSYSLSYFMDIGIRYNTSFTKISNLDAVLERRKLFNQYLQFSLLLKLAN